MIDTNKYLAYTYCMLSIMVLSVAAFRSYAFDENQPGFWVIIAVVTPFIVALGFRRLLEIRLLPKTPLLYQPKTQFLIDLALYISLGITFFCVELFVYEHTLVIALKMFAWTTMIGYFASIDSALERERQGFNANRDSYLDEQNSKCDIAGHKVSVAQRLNLFFSVTVLITILACTLSAYSYMGLDDDIVQAKQAFIVDILFIMGIVVSLTVRLIYSYSLNLQFLFDTQVNGLRAIQRGELENLVPVLSSDEFGVIAQQTNAMIEELREKHKIQKTLEQIVGSDIMRKLLKDDSRDLKQGQEFEIGILFCDLRKFTTYTENTPSDEVIFFLNAYFTKVADIVAEHNGIINKFMGDAILAVFGVNESTNYIEEAIETAWDIVMHSNCVKMQDGTTIDIGIGVHKGLATACTIGSTDRYEYTFIGDAVNTASRLDGLSKELGYKIITSAEVYDSINTESQSQFTDLGMHSIRGKNSSVHLYGAVAKTQNAAGNVIPFADLRGK